MSGDGVHGQGGHQSAADGGYYVPPPSGDPGAGATYPGGRGWQDVASGSGGPGGAPGIPGVPVPPPPPPGRKLGFSALRIVVIVAIVFGGSIWAFFTSANRGDDGTITRAGDLDVRSLQVGDCFDDPGALEEVASIRAIPCDDPHDNEVFFEFELPAAAELPSRQAIDDEIGARCLPAFDSFVGARYETSELDLFTFEPTADGWRKGDRTVLCAVYDLSGEKLVGTARGAGR